MAIDYELMKRESPKLKGALTRAVKSGDPEQVKAACKAAVVVWDRAGAWPDNWSNWQRALDDSRAWNDSIRLEDL